MKTLILLLLLITFLYLFSIRPRMHRPDSAPFKNCLFAHRGLHNLKKGVPENSLLAFRQAVEGAYGIELDVQLTRDGIPVVFHDASLSRMCAIDRRLDSMTFEALKGYPLAGTDEKIPSLSEVLTLVGGRVPLLIEIKMDHFDLRIPRTINDLLKTYPGQYCIESFHPAALWWYRHNRPDVLRGQLSTHFNAENHSLSPLQFLLGKMVLNVISRPDFISYNWRFSRDFSLFLCRRLFKADAAGWVIRSEKELQTCRQRFNMFIFESFMPENYPGIRPNRNDPIFPAQNSLF